MVSFEGCVYTCSDLRQRIRSASARGTRCARGLWHGIPLAQQAPPESYCLRGTTTRTARESIMIERRGALLEAPTVDRDRRALGGAGAGSALLLFVLCSIRCACGHRANGDSDSDGGHRACVAVGRNTRDLEWRRAAYPRCPARAEQSSLCATEVELECITIMIVSVHWALTGCAKVARIDREAGGSGARAAGTNAALHREERGRAPGNKANETWRRQLQPLCGVQDTDERLGVATRTRDVRVRDAVRRTCGFVSVAGTTYFCTALLAGVNRMGAYLRRSRAIWQVTCGGDSDGVDGVQENVCPGRIQYSRPRLQLLRALAPAMAHRTRSGHSRRIPYKHSGNRSFLRIHRSAQMLGISCFAHLASGAVLLRIADGVRVDDRAVPSARKGGGIANGDGAYNSAEEGRIEHKHC
ncbi:hypothetical protein GGX14DRAFT_666757 [Mycena pura]|uniref:Uncharacterized protein n=1 Tax=Mycena pura TaxID=153505 RepID=A0AAD6UZM0_9AGAR|nr:hypothetical protein GGX14DRAFT_666757 [Mycena pura]